MTGRSNQTGLLIRGADISSLAKSEDLGGVYRDAQGNLSDALMILKQHGLNYARLRVWVNSPDGYHGKKQLLAMAKRLKAHGIKLLVDFHYADTWADPGKQPKPVAWNGLDFVGIKKALYDHTFDICSCLAAKGTPADMVQIGNEINNGMVWPEGKNDVDFTNLAALIQEGIRAVKECSPGSRIMLHVAEGGRNHIFRRWFDAILAEGVNFDVLGVSYYPYWHGTLAEFKQNLDDLAKRYQRDIVVVETAYPFAARNKEATSDVIQFEMVEGYPATPEGQAKMLAAVMKIIREVPDGRGLGFFWWDGTWICVPGNGWDPQHPDTSGNNWDNQVLFDFEGKPLPALALFRQE